MTKPISTKNAAPTKPVRLIYCGPSIPGGSLPQFSVYKGGYPLHLDELLAKCPAVKALFVPVADLAKTQQAMNIKGTPENILYQEALAFTRKGGE